MLQNQEKCEIDMLKNISNTLHFSKINIILSLLFHPNSIKIILSYEA